MSTPGTPIWIWRYQLTSAGPLNRASDRCVHEGVLVRTGGGYGCIHPWPELGDADLGQELDALRQGQPLRLARNALACAQVDAAARARGRWLFDGFEMPASHALWPPTGAEAPAVVTDRVHRLIGEGFEALKIKTGPPLDDMLPRLECIVQAAAGRLRLRLDFNATLTQAELRQFAGLLSPLARAAIELVEDPLPYAPGVWGELAAETGLVFALDRDLHRGTSGYQIAVVKPSTLTANARRAAANRPVLVTSSMQHPLGQLYDAWMSREFHQPPDAPLVGCGLLTHECYATDPFIERMSRRGPVLVPPSGATGLGFDDLLETLPWTRLTC